MLENGHVLGRFASIVTKSKPSPSPDIVFAIPEPGGVVESQQQKIDELMECVAYFERL